MTSLYPVGSSSARSDGSEEKKEPAPLNMPGDFAQKADSIFYIDEMFTQLGNIALETLIGMRDLG